MHVAIFQARTRKKVSLPLSCLITTLMLDTGVPTAEGDIWLTAATTIINITLKRMKRPMEPEDEPAVKETEVPTADSSMLVEIFMELKSLTSKFDLMECRMGEMEKAMKSVWKYTQKRDLLLRRFLTAKDALLAEDLPAFHAGIYPVPSPSSSYNDELNLNSPGGDPFGTP